MSAQCDCIAKVDAMLAERNTRLVLPIMLGDDQTPRPMIVTEKIRRGRGQPPATAMFATYCPFCGVRCSAEPDA
jgi:hypothetical protein